MGFVGIKFPHVGDYFFVCGVFAEVGTLDEGDTELGVDGVDAAFVGGGVAGHVGLEDGCVDTCSKVADRLNCHCGRVKVARP